MAHDKNRFTLSSETAILGYVVGGLATKKGEGTQVRASRRIFHWAALGCAALLTAGVGVKAADAASARPDFRAPWPCGQTRDYFHHDGEVVNAIDFNIPGGTDYGTPVLAAAAGTVASVGVNGGYGNEVIVSHSGGWSTRVGHLSAFSVQAGQAVTRGQELGKVGSTGNSSGPHLHFEEMADGARQSVVVDGVAMNYDGQTRTHLSNNCGTGGGETPTVTRKGASSVYTGSKYVVLGSNGAGHIYQDVWANGWSDWQDLGGTIVGAPALTLHDDRYDIFAVGTSGAIYQRSKAGTGGWSGWTSLGGTFVGGAGAVYIDGDYHVFGINAAGHLWQRVWDGAWSAWQDLGAGVAGTPAVTGHDHRIDVFALGTSGAMFQKSWAPSTSWTAWRSLGGQFTDGPGATFGDGKYYLYGISDGAHRLWQNVWNGAWSGWQDLGGMLAGSPTATYHDNRVDVFAESPNGPMFQRVWEPSTSWTSWRSIGGDFR